jgi:hypothetical protein
MDKELKIGVVGAGIQGISNALFLQKKVLMLQFLTRMNLEALLHLMVMLVIFLRMHLFQ